MLSIIFCIIKADGSPSSEVLCAILCVLIPLPNKKSPKICKNYYRNKNILDEMGMEIWKHLYMKKQKV